MLPRAQGGRDVRKEEDGDVSRSPLESPEGLDNFEGIVAVQKGKENIGASIAAC